MARKLEDSRAAIEIKKEYLKEHLEQFKGLIEKWVPELNAVDPLAPQGGSWGWASVYRSSLEQDSDSNHMLRRHLRSRALWGHHSNWERELEHVWYVTKEVRKQADLKHSQRAGNQGRRYTESYIGSALWKGFELACGQKFEMSYRLSDGAPGVNYGAFRIEQSAKSAKECSRIEREHQGLIHEIAEMEEMKGLAVIWGAVLELQEHMRAIASGALRSNDILNPCRFCSRLWK